jgi:hypothetical protein
LAAASAAERGPAATRRAGEAQAEKPEDEVQAATIPTSLTAVKIKQTIRDYFDYFDDCECQSQFLSLFLFFFFFNFNFKQYYVHRHGASKLFTPAGTDYKNTSNHKYIF